MASSSSPSGNAAEIDRLALALAKEPGSKAFMPLAEEYGKAGMWQEAAAVLEDGLKAYPNFITAMVALGRTYDQLNQPVKAKAILEEAIRLSPENLRAHRTLAKIYVAEGANDAALRSCAVILAVNPQDQEALSIKAAVTVEARAATAPIPLSSPESGAAPLAQATTSAVVPPDMVQGAVTLREEDVATGSSGLVPGDLVTQRAAISASSIRRETRVRRLEQWLAAIQSRRRSHGSATSPA